MTATAAAVDLAAVKTRQQATWASGDFAEIATLIVPVAERLCDAVDLRAGSRVLDVATGSGNAAIAAARLGCDVVGIDYVPALLERGRLRAAAERLEVDLREGDAEQIPFEDASFDAVVSVYGSMFAPDHGQAAAEIARVCRPGGRIGLASWTPSGFVGAMFQAVAQIVPPPPGVPSPMLWGIPEHVDALFGDTVEWKHTAQTFTFRFTSPAAFADFFGRFYGPTVKALEAAGDRRRELQAALRRVARDWNRLADHEGAIAVPGEYLESVGVRTASAAA